jgi:hypothetical protein
MGGLSAWLATISWPIVSRVFASLGIGTVTFVGAQAAITAAVATAKTAFGGLTVELGQLLARAGFFDSLAIMAGGVIAGLSWMLLKRFALQTTG